MTPKFVTKQWAEGWYQVGTRYRDRPSRRAAINAAIDDGHEIVCWEAAAAFGAGYQGLPFEIKTWKRYGDIPMGYDGYAAPSVNHAENESERGVSVADDEWENSLRGQISIIRQTKPLVTFRGIQVGYGSDGEPVVLPVQE